MSILLLLITMAAGLLVRFVHLGLAQPIVKYGGSALWALMLYWIVSACFSSKRLPAAAMTTALLATVVEFFKLYHSPALEAFRRTLPGILLLGRHFSVWDIVVYCLAILGGAFADRVIRASRQP